MNIEVTTSPSFAGLSPVSVMDDQLAWIIGALPVRASSPLLLVGDVIPASFPIVMAVAHDDPDVSGMLPPGRGEEIMGCLGGPDLTCTYLLWEGYGFLRLVDAHVSGVRVTIQGRRYFALSGPLNQFRSFRPEFPLETASWWWPLDRSWIVHTDIDGESTVVGVSDPEVAARLARLPYVTDAEPSGLYDDPGVQV